MTTRETRERLTVLRLALRKAVDDDRVTPGDRLQAVAEALAGAFGANRCILGRVRAGSATAVAGVGLGLAGIRPFAALPVGKGIVGRAVRTGETQRVDDVLRDPDYYAIAAPTRAELVTPVLQDGRPVLMINLESNQKAAFSAADAEVLEGAARWLAGRLERLGLGVSGA
jgi:GAF domain-containing protein